MRCAVDSSVVIAALLSWHEQHDIAAKTLNGLLGKPRDLLLPLPVLIESYAVMTRLPAPHRLSPKDSHALLSETFATVRIIAAKTETSWAFLESAAIHAVAGGSTYDAWIVQCLRSAPCRRLYTFNERHFARWAEDEFEIVIPGI